MKVDLDEGLPWILKNFDKCNMIEKLKCFQFLQMYSFGN